MKYFKIYRWDPEVEGQKPYVATYAINMDECVMGKKGRGGGGEGLSAVEGGYRGRELETRLQ